MVAVARLEDLPAAALKAERLRREEYARTIETPWMDGLAPVQREAFAGSRIALNTGRKAGKTWAVVAWLLEAAAKVPRSLVPFIGLTRESAKLIIWPMLEELRDRYRIDLELVEHTAVARLRNGSMIKIWGADQDNLTKRLLGPKYPRAAIDEAASFRPGILETLIDEVLEPALGFYEHAGFGQLALASMPGVVPAGYMHDVVTGKRPGWRVRHWTILQNPYWAGDPQVYLDGVLARRGWTSQNPTFRRQYLGEWVEDLDSLVYKFEHDRDCYSELPRGLAWSRILGIDYGYRDATALAVVTYSLDHPTVYVEHSEAHTSWWPSKIAKRIEELTRQYAPVAIVADSGALGKMITVEMLKQHRIPMTDAAKTDKLGAIELFNGALLDGRLKFHASLAEHHHEMRSLTWDTSDDGKRREHPAQPNNRCDATLYAYRASPHWACEAPVVPPARGTREHAIADARAMEERDEEALTVRDWRESP